VKLSPYQPASAALRAFALLFPGAYEEFPWGETALKVKGKVFVFLRADANGLNFSVKLPKSCTTALDQPFAEPTGYGLGKSGWVTSRFEGGDSVPVDMLKPWIDESYRAVAPKSFVKVLDGGAASALAPIAKVPRRKKTKSTRKARARPAAKKRAKGRARKRK
jgi:predicted DNA-binding protein (MmcQ/YjbR family)